MRAANGGTLTPYALLANVVAGRMSYMAPGSRARKGARPG